MNDTNTESNILQEFLPDNSSNSLSNNNTFKEDIHDSDFFSYLVSTDNYMEEKEKNLVDGEDLDPELGKKITYINQVDLL